MHYHTVISSHIHTQDKIYNSFLSQLRKYTNTFFYDELAQVGWKKLWPKSDHVKQGPRCAFVRFSESFSCT